MPKRKKREGIKATSKGPKGDCATLKIAQITEKAARKKYPGCYVTIESYSDGSHQVFVSDPGAGEGW